MVAVPRLSLVAASRGLLSGCGVPACGSRCSARAPGCLGSVAAWAQASLLLNMWDLPRPGIKPVSPASPGRFLTTGPPGKPGTMTFEDFYRL